MSTSTSTDRPMRAALGNRALVLAPLAYLACTIAEWAQFLGVLVDAYARSGTRAAGLASLALVLPAALTAPLAGSAARRVRPERVLLASALVQVVAFAGGAVAAAPGTARVRGGGVRRCRRRRDHPAAADVRSVAAGSGAFTARTVGGQRLVRVGRECERAGRAVARHSPAGGRRPWSVLVGCSVLAMAAGVALLTMQHHHDAGDRSAAGDRGPGLFGSVRALRRRPGALGVLAVASGQYLLIGAFDLVLVVLALDVLDLGQAGSGWLSTAVGVGALVSTVVASALLRRPRLASFLMASAGTIAVGLIVLALAPSLPMALVALPVVGCSRAILSLSGRMLLQRSSPPQALASVFAALELFAGICMTLGSGLAQVLIALGGARLALGAIGALFVVMLLGTARALLVADDGADVPVVAMSLLRRLPVFAPLPALALEAVARAAVEVSASAGQHVITEGDPGDRYYAVVDGTFDVVMGGELIRTVRRGSDFGEVALLAGVPRTATVTATTDGLLLAIDRDPFLLAVTGSASAHDEAWSRVRQMRFLQEVARPAHDSQGAASPDQTSSSSSPR